MYYYTLLLPKIKSVFVLQCFALLLILVFMPAYTKAEIIRVPDNYHTIQAAIDAAATKGDEIVVAPGTYNEAINYLGKNINLHSADGPDVTVIDASGLGKVAIKCANTDSISDTVLAGFTVKRGNSSDGGGMRNTDCKISIDNCIFSNNYGDYGGAINNSGTCEVVISNCWFDNNFSVWGGAIYNRGPVIFNIQKSDFNQNRASSNGGAICSREYGTRLTIVDCSFIENQAGSGPDCGGDGGAIYNDDDADSVINYCTFTGNLSYHGGGAIQNGLKCFMQINDCLFESNYQIYEKLTSGQGGGAIRNSYKANGIIKRTIFRDNHGTEGGAVANVDGATFSFVDCTFENNSADTNPTFFCEGGAVYDMGRDCNYLNCRFFGNRAKAGGAIAWFGTGTIINCIIADNQARDTGGGIQCFEYGGQYCDLNMTQCVIYNNTAGDLGGGLYNKNNSSQKATVKLFNTIVYGNSAPDKSQICNQAFLTLGNCCVEGGYNSNQLIVDCDPLFIDPANGNYELSPGSPCIDAGNNNAVPLEIKTDMLGNPRIVDDTGKPDLGNGTAPIVDIGACEFQGTSFFSLTVNPTPLVSNQQAEFIITNALPNNSTWFLYSMTGWGSTYISQLNVTIDIESPVVFGSKMVTDEMGDTLLQITIPSISKEKTIWFQAVQRNQKSNVIATHVMPQ